MKQFLDRITDAADDDVRGKAAHLVSLLNGVVYVATVKDSNRMEFSVHILLRGAEDGLVTVSVDGVSFQQWADTPKWERKTITYGEDADTLRIAEYVNSVIS